MGRMRPRRCQVRQFAPDLKSRVASIAEACLRGAHWPGAWDRPLGNGSCMARHGMCLIAWHIPLRIYSWRRYVSWYLPSGICSPFNKSTHINWSERWTWFVRTAADIIFRNPHWRCTGALGILALALEESGCKVRKTPSLLTLAVFGLKRGSYNVQSWITLMTAVP